MAKFPARARASMPLPSSINWGYVHGPVYHFMGIDPQRLIDAGMCVTKQLPTGNRGAVRNGDHWKIASRKDGLVNAYFCSPYAVAKDANFRAFLDVLLVDTRLSLVRDENEGMQP